MDKRNAFIALCSILVGSLITLLVTSTGKPGTIEPNTMSMQQMISELKNKSGDDFDAAFISGMIAHHQGAIDMARLAQDRAEHDEIKQLSTAIIAAQQQEIKDMERWRTSWSYDKTSPMPGMDHSGH